MNFLIRADASFEIGTGHVIRCIALGQMLSEEKHNVIFVTNSSQQKVIDRIANEKFKVIKITEYDNLLKDSEYTAKYAKNNEIDLVITDGYKFETEYQTIIKNYGLKLMCIDDIAKCHYVSDYILNQNINAEKIFKYSCENYTKLFLGLRYVLLRREFRELRGWRRSLKNECKNILITMGGSDENNNTLKVLKAFEKNDTKLSIKTLLGFTNVYIDSILNYMKESKHSIEVVQNSNNVVSLIKWCDLAVSASGSTVWELLKLNTPIVTGFTVENQIAINEQLKEKELAYSIGDINNIEIEELSNKLINVISDSGIREKLFMTVKNIFIKHKMLSVIPEICSNLKG